MKDTLDFGLSAAQTQTVWQDEVAETVKIVCLILWDRLFP